MKKKTSQLSGLIVAVISIVISLLFAEIYLRIFHKEIVDTAILRSRLDEGDIKELIQPSKNPGIFFELKPNLKINFRESLVVTSAEGYRISTTQPDPSSEKAAIRIAVLGDSTSFGWRVNYENTYLELFRRQMELDSGKSIELRNYSVPGYNSKQELYTFLDKIRPYKPDLIILHYDHNDAQPTGKGYAPNYLPPEYGDNALNSALLKLILREIREYQNRDEFKFGETEHKLLDGYIIAGPLYDEHLLALQTLANETKSLGIPTVVILFNAFVKADDNYQENISYIVLHKDLKTKLENMGFYVLDLYPYYQTKMKELGLPDLSESWISKEPFDGHPNWAGHKFISETLTNYVVNDPDLMSIFEQELN